MKNNKDSDEILDILSKQPDKNTEDSKSYWKNYWENYKPLGYTRVIGIGDFGEKYGKDAVEKILDILNKQTVKHDEFEKTIPEYSFVDDSLTDDDVKALLKDKDITIIVADSSSCIETTTRIANISKSAGLLTIAVVTDESDEGTNALLSVSDSVVLLPHNENDDIIKAKVQGAISIIVNVFCYDCFIAMDFEDVKKSFSDAGKAYLAIGTGNTVEEITENLLSTLPQNICCGFDELFFELAFTDRDYANVVFLFDDLFNNIADKLGDKLQPNCNVMVSAHIEPTATKTYVNMILKHDPYKRTSIIV